MGSGGFSNFYELKGNSKNTNHLKAKDRTITEAKKAWKAVSRLLCSLHNRQRIMKEIINRPNRPLNHLIMITDFLPIQECISTLPLCLLFCSGTVYCHILGQFDRRQTVLFLHLPDQNWSILLYRHPSAQEYWRQFTVYTFESQWPEIQLWSMLPLDRTFFVFEAILRNRNKNSRNNAFAFKNYK